jgi:hypothetical protein
VAFRDVVEKEVFMEGKGELGKFLTQRDDDKIAGM